MGLAESTRPIQASGKQYGDQFGYSAELNDAGDILAVACRACDTDGMSNNGKVTIYELNNEDQWKLVGAPIPGEGEQDGGDGIFIDIDSLGNTIIGS